MIELSQRQYLALRLLREYQKPIPGQQFSQLLNVSPRTLRYEVKAINQIAGQPIILSSKEGYSLSEEPAVLQQIQDCRVDDDQQLEKQLILSLLECKEASIYDLAQEYYVSESTIYGLIKRIMPKFHSFSLSLQRHGEWLSCQGKETDKRRMLSHFFFAEANSLATTLVNFDDYFSPFSLAELAQMIHQTLEELNVQIDDIYIKNIIICIAVCVQRMLNGYPSDRSEAEENKLILSCSPRLTRFVDSVCGQLENQLKLTFTEADKATILAFITGSFPEENEQILQNESFRGQIRKLLDKTFRHFQLELDYSAVFDNFILHVHFLLLRCRHQNFFHNDFATSLRTSHPFIYDVAVYLAYQLEKTFEVIIPGDEIGLIAIYLGSIATYVPTYDLPRVICICPQYHELRKLMVQQLTEKLSCTLDIIKIVSSLSEITDQDHADFYLSTVRTEKNLNDLIQISPILSPIEIHRIEKKNLEFMKVQKRRRLRQNLLRFFDDQLFFCNHGLTNEGEILAFFDKQLQQMGVIDDQFMDSVRQREALSSTAFFNRFAVPHSLEKAALSTKVVYYYSDEPIRWYDSRVNLVLLILSSNDDEQSSKIYNLIFDILIDESCYKKMILCRSRKELMDFLEIHSD
ncbi:BglG family transcription antiterminator [Holdemania massiliensis]|uniref:BglG family transcription antiterminator n=1 Tax=Holdemania massiliensis TaxID=1468449 RepID=UPI001F06BC16|nr:PRD domain-containing protein [Holdemania massiliensis]MCH1942630.1 PRD domain-containing protein [Holdemania massiliensis]